MSAKQNPESQQIQSLPISRKVQTKADSSSKIFQQQSRSRSAKRPASSG
ncbi:MAG: hypothetical protein JZU53_07880 [Paludibacter sp.]|nr:hypothetical protein [Paludibacter sp.]